MALDISVVTQQHNDKEVSKNSLDKCIVENSTYLSDVHRIHIGPITKPTIHMTVFLAEKSEF